MTPTPEPLPVTGCAASGQTQYATSSEAASALYGLQRRGRAKRGLRVYRCPICRGWHLTNQERR